MLKIDIISREAVRPSSPTPTHLRTFRLSLLDQFMPPFFVPIILHYSYDDCASHRIGQPEMARRLKTSLSEALTLYYPFAGRMKGECSVDCNDEGVDYLEARVAAVLSDAVEFPDVDKLSQLIPHVDKGSEEEEEETNIGGVQFAFQVNLFDCGGIAIGIFFSHRIADGCTLISFIKAWSALARADPNVVGPSFASASIFPPRNPLGYNPKCRKQNQRPVTRRFSFNAGKLAELKAEVAAGSSLERPTRVELVTAMIWMRMARKCGDGLTLVSHSVNLRGRMDPPLPESSFGNIFRSMEASAEGEMDLASLVEKVREGVGKLDKEHIKELQGENGWALIMERINRVGELCSNKEVKILRFSSWCRFPFHQVDFGWGKPVWVSSACWEGNDAIILMDDKCGDGIEAWITMEGEDMEEFERDPQLRHFVSIS